MAKKKKELTFETLIADSFIEKLKEADFKTIVRRGSWSRLYPPSPSPPPSHNFISTDVHIQGTRKKHVLQIFRCDGTLSIFLKSERLHCNYKLFKKKVNIEDPKFSLAFLDDILDKTVRFMGYMKDIDDSMFHAHKILDSKDSYFGGRSYNPSKKPSRSGV